ncbi:MAG: hydroxymethylglutaryl-CoA lyase [Acidiferrobacterales bacterium]|nr:hydroxymethylglutaryl-CoA lyase [Acidiferrobacterales bacterium]
MQTTDIIVSEVGPRDGLQSIESIMPTADKKRWIKALADSGISEIEVGSFVPAKLLPQLADTKEVVEFALQIESLTVAVLVPNLIGAKAATKAGAHKITLPFSVSEAHSQKNLRRSHAQIFDEVAAIKSHIESLPIDKRPHFETSLSTAFGCALEGKISVDLVKASAERLMSLGADEVGLSDTTGYATPKQVTHLIKAVRSVVGDQQLTGIHLHNTRGLGLANTIAALDMGITTIDSSMAGIGGCPFAPGASGNIVTEDLLFMLDSMGLNTGIDLEKLLDARAVLADALPNEELYGFIPEAGLPLGFMKD